MATFGIRNRYAPGGSDRHVVGLEKTQAALLAFGATAVRELEGLLYREGESIIGDAKEHSPRVPVDTGALTNSGFVDFPKRVNGQTVVELGFGGPAGRGNQGATNAENVGYAEVVHYDLEANHDGEGEGPLFLSTHFERHASSMDKRFADELKQKLARL